MVETKMKHTTELQSAGALSRRNGTSMPIISACLASAGFTGGPPAISSGVMYNEQCRPQMKEAVW